MISIISLFLAYFIYYINFQIGFYDVPFFKIRLILFILVFIFLGFTKIGRKGGIFLKNLTKKLLFFFCLGFHF